MSSAIEVRGTLLDMGFIATKEQHDRLEVAGVEELKRAHTELVGGVERRVGDPDRSARCRRRIILVKSRRRALAISRFVRITRHTMVSVVTEAR
jgi:hypothetical protein